MENGVFIVYKGIDSSGDAIIGQRFILPSIDYSYGPEIKKFNGISWGWETSYPLSRFSDLAPIEITDVESIVANENAFAALLSNSSIRVWGLIENKKPGFTPNIPSGVKKLFAAGSHGFVAVMEDGSVRHWGAYYDIGALMHMSTNLIKTVDHEIISKDEAVEVVDVVGQDEAFQALAFAILGADGSVRSFGHPETGGEMLSGSMGNPTITHVRVQSGAVKVVVNKGAFAVLMHDGTVRTFGCGEMYDPGNLMSIIYQNGGYGRLCSSGNTGGYYMGYHPTNPINAISGLNGVIDIIAHKEIKTFTALRNDGAIEFWGKINHVIKLGTDCIFKDGIYQSGTGCVISAKATKDQIIYLYENGNVNSKGETSSVQDQYNVRKIFSTREFFAAQKADGSAIVWSNTIHPPRVFQGEFENIYEGKSMVALVFKNGTAIVVQSGLSSQDTVVSLGKFKSITATKDFIVGFAAILEDGSVKTFPYGQNNHGITSGAVEVVMGGFGFSAIVRDHSAGSAGGYAKTLVPGPAEAVKATAAELNVLKGINLTTAELSRLKTMPATIDDSVVAGLYASTDELNYADLNASFGAEASKVVTSDASNHVQMQHLLLNKSSFGNAFVLSTTGVYDSSMSERDCKNAGFGAYTAKINNAAAPKGCVHFSGLSFYNEHPTGYADCAGVYACIKKVFGKGLFNVRGEAMPSAEVLNSLNWTLNVSQESVNHWQSLDANVQASHLNPMQGLKVEKDAIERLVIQKEGSSEPGKVLTADASGQVTIDLNYDETTASFAGTACNGTVGCEAGCSADSSCAGYTETKVVAQQLQNQIVLV